jgi:DNA-binding CsgD family transcriptional regulator
VPGNVGIQSNELRRVIFLILAVLILSFTGIWTNVIGYGSAYLPNDEILIHDNGTLIAYFFGTASCGVFFLLLPNRPKKEVTIYWGIALVAAFSALSYAMIYRQSLFNSQAISVIGCWFLGFSHLWLAGKVYILLAKEMAFKYCVMVISLALVMEMIITPLASALDNVFGQLAIGVLLPIAIAAIYSYLHSFSVSRSQINESGRSALTRRTAIAQTTMIVVAVAAIVIMQALTEPGIWGDDRFSGNEEAHHFQDVLAGCFVLLILAFLAFSFSKQNNVVVRFIPGFAILVTGFFIISLSEFFGARDTFTIHALAVAIEGFTHLLLWLLIIDVTIKTTKPLRFVGVVGVIHGMLSIVWLLFLADFNGLASAILFASIYVVVLVSFMMMYVIQEGQNTISRSDTLSGGLNTVQESLLAVATEYNLSKRETEIFLLMIEGKSRPQIAAELTIAESTVKTHIIHIYEKLSVNSKAEMFALVNRVRKYNTI